MMHMGKFIDFFDPSELKGVIHIIGCGAIGSTLGVALARIGVPEVHLWDFDVVSSHNIANQTFNATDIGQLKTTSLATQIKKINPVCKVHCHDAGWQDNTPLLAGYVFLAVDSIELRQKIVKINMYNQNIIAFFDFRMELKSAQHYAADWNSVAQRKNLVRSMDFTDAEAKANVPVSACNMEMSIFPTVQAIIAFGVANFINFVKNPESLRLMMLVNPFDLIVND